MIRLALALFLIAEGAVAARIVNLKSLSPDGAEAIVTYDKAWVEIDLSLNGGARPLAPPRDCDWTSMAYAPTSGDLAMTAFCPGPVRACVSGSSRLFLRVGDGAPREVLNMPGARLSDLSWHADEKRLVLIETQIKAPEVSGLDDLNRSAPRCGWRDAALRMVDLPRAQAIRFDILPDGWRPRQVIAMNDDALTAVVSARRGATDGSPAAEAINAACAGRSAAFAGLRAVCTARGYDLLLTWMDGEWTLGLGDAPSAAPTRGRALATPSRAVTARERCSTSQNADLVGLTCRLTVARDGDAMEIIAPGGLFGDLALSGDGRVLAAIYASRSIRGRRFDVWDLATGESRSLAPLLDAVRHFGGWPPSR